MESILRQRPDQIRAFFGANLAELVKSERSVADFGRKLGINRTQILRFVAGTAFPRPDVLQQICNYFKVDAGILTTPL
jgi:transcriptional regulator with XRE-family HTH domain